jgi:hypothetical protein
VKGKALRRPGCAYFNSQGRAESAGIDQWAQSTPPLALFQPEQQMCAYPLADMQRPALDALGADVSVSKESANAQVSPSAPFGCMTMGSPAAMGGPCGKLGPYTSPCAGPPAPPDPNGSRKKKAPPALALHALLPRALRRRAYRQSLHEGAVLHPGRAAVLSLKLRHQPLAPEHQRCGVQRVIREIGLLICVCAKATASGGKREERTAKAVTDMGRLSG